MRVENEASFIMTNFIICNVHITQENKLKYCDWQGMYSECEKVALISKF